VNADSVASKSSLVEGEEKKKLAYSSEDIVNLEQAVKKQPDNPEVYIELSKALAEAGKVVQAYSTFRAARAIAPESIELLKLGGKIHKMLSRRDEAIEMLEKVFRACPDDLDSILSLVDLLFESGRREEALSYLGALKKQEIKCPDIYIKEAQIHLSLGNAAEAQRSISEYREFAGNTREMFVLLGQTMLKREFFDGAVKNFTEAVNCFPDDADMYLGLGRAYLGMGEKGRALLEFEQGQRKAQGNIEILIELGKLQSAMGNEEIADETFVKIEKSKYVTGENFLELARHFLSRDKAARAVKYLEKARELSPYHEDILQVLGQTHEKLKNFTKATETYEQGLLGYAKAIWAHEGIIRCAGLTGNFDLKAQSQKKLLETGTQTAELWCDYGETLIRTGEFDLAQKAFERAAKLDPTCVRAYQAPELIKLERARAEGENLVEQAKSAIEKKFFLTATERLERALELVPTEIAWKKLLAEVSLKTADISRASGLLAKIRASDPGDYRTTFELARTYEFENKVQLAIELLSSLCKDHPLKLEAHLMLLRLKRSQIRGSRVEAEMFDALIRNLELELAHFRKDSPVPLLVKGYAAYIFSYRSSFQNDGFNKAVASFNEALTRYGDNENAIEGLSLVERARGNSEKAVEYCKKLIRISSSPDKLKVLARLHENFQHFAEARKCYTSLRNLFPENGLYRRKTIEMIAVLSRSGSKNELMNLLSEHSQSIQSQPEQAWVLFETALVQQLIAETSTNPEEWKKKSLLNWHKAANHLQTNHWIRWGMLEAQFKFLKNPERQRAAATNLKACEKILREMPDNSQAYQAVARCYMAFKDLTNTDKALKFLEKAWFLSREHTDTGFMLARTAKELGKSVIVDAVGYNMILLEPELAISIFQL
jgi:tetratricopeptide (TPR) repeat protein